MTRLLLAATFLLALTPSALALKAHGGNDRVSFGQDITIDVDETGGDVVCAFCSVHLHGDVKGDVAVLFGNLIIDQDHSVSGDVAVLGGNVSINEGAWVSGDVAIAAGDLKVSPGGAVNGDRAVFPARFWILIPFAPLLIVIGVIWLIVWLVRRNRYPRYPVVRRF
jgi:hypothetical protein